jgi:hypothetical protein
MIRSSKISIIILNWNGKNDTLECLQSVQEIDYPNFDVIVVDNGSKDDSVRAVRARFPKVAVCETGKNLGYAGGNNVGMRYALENGAEYILLLNNDTVVDSGVLKGFMQASELIPQGGIFAAKIYYYAEPTKLWYAGIKRNDQRFCFEHIGDGLYDDELSFNAIAETDYACGCCLFIPAKIVRTIGLLDEAFFLVFEETDWCYRARQNGHKCYLIPQAKVWHKVSASFGGDESPLFNYFMTRNRLLWAKKHLSCKKRVSLYKIVIAEIFSSTFPKFHLNRGERALFIKTLYWGCCSYLRSLRRQLTNPLNRARMLGVLDYFLRRFGDCPHDDLKLNNSK